MVLYSVVKQHRVECVCVLCVYVYVCVVFGDWKSNFSLLMGKQNA